MFLLDRGAYRYSSPVERALLCRVIKAAAREGGFTPPEGLGIAEVIQPGPAEHGLERRASTVIDQGTEIHAMREALALVSPLEILAY